MSHPTPSPHRGQRTVCAPKPGQCREFFGVERGYCLAFTAATRCTEHEAAVQRETSRCQCGHWFYGHSPSGACMDKSSEGACRCPEFRLRET